MNLDTTVNFLCVLFVSGRGSQGLGPAPGHLDYSGDFMLSNESEGCSE